MGLTNPFALYRQLIDVLVAKEQTELRPLHRLGDPVPPDRRAVSLRHDIDGDVSTGLRAARHLARHGVPGSFFLLHVSFYYGRFGNGRFYRHAAMGSYVEGFIVAGCELGLHCDPLSVYLNQGTDGSEAVAEEIRWLRSQGAQIRGTVAHNSAPNYGAENFEVFRGRALADRRSLQSDGITVPLQSLDEESLGLAYEGNFPSIVRNPSPATLSTYLAPPPADAVRNRDWLHIYFLDNPIFERGYDVDIWLLGRDSWVLAHRGARKRLLWPLSTAKMLQHFQELPSNSRVVFNIHPEYVSDE